MGAGGLVVVFQVRGGSGGLFAFERAVERAVELFDTSGYGASELDPRVVFVLLGVESLSQ